MPYLEKPSDLAEAIADMAMVYGSCTATETEPCTVCRICFVGEMEKRISESVKNERILLNRC